MTIRSAVQARAGPFFFVAFLMEHRMGAWGSAGMIELEARELKIERSRESRDLPGLVASPVAPRSCKPA